MPVPKPPQSSPVPCPRPLRGITASGRRGVTSGLTLIEILVTVGIITLLATILLVGFSKVGTSARNSQARAFLAAADAILQDYEVAQGEDGFERYVELMTGTGGDYLYDVYDATGARLDAPADGTAAFAQLEIGEDPPSALAEPRIVGQFEIIDDPDGARYGVVGPVQTQIAIDRMRRVSSINETLSQMPTGAFVDPAGANLPADDAHIATGNGTAPLLADAWGNPLVLVPSGGLVGVFFEQHGDEPHRITARGIIEPANPTGTSWPDALPVGDIPAGSRAFWASAGPDGDLSTGDDNLYSFEGN